MEDLADLIARRSRELNISNSEIARRAKVSRGYIGNIVNRTAPTPSGGYNLSPEVARQLAKAIEVNEIDVARAMSYVVSEKEADPKGFYRGIASLPPDRQAIANRQIQAIIDSLAEEEDPDTDYI